MCDDRGKDGGEGGWSATTEMKACTMTIPTHILEGINGLNPCVNAANKNPTLLLSQGD